MKNLRGNYPQNAQSVGGNDNQQGSYNTFSNITNWNSISSVIDFLPHNGDGTNPCRNMNYAQDFMAGNKGLRWIRTSIYGYYRTGYRDLTFKLSRLKSDWNTYFTNLDMLLINEDHWNHEDLSALKKLKIIKLTATTQSHDDIQNDAIIPIAPAVIDNLLNQVAAGAGAAGVKNGFIVIVSGGSNRTTASDAAFSQLTSAGWTITISGTNM